MGRPQLIVTRMSLLYLQLDVQNQALLASSGVDNDCDMISVSSTPPKIIFPLLLFLIGKAKPMIKKKEEECH